MAKDSLVSNLLEQSPNRRSLLRKLGMATAAVGTIAAGGEKSLLGQASSPTVVDVLQFALNLEYLEAEFYTTATMGKTIDQVGIGIDGPGVSGATTGWNQVNFSNNFIFTGQVAMEIGADERAHVTLLRGALNAAGYPPNAKPPINLNALGIGFGNELQFLTLARIFEDIGVSAYAYAAGQPFVANTPYIGTAAQILAAEAEHVGNIRLEVARLNISTTALDGVDIIPPPSGTKFMSLDNNGLCALRSPGQVLYLAYGGVANMTSGGFFPMGVNGTLKTSSAHA